MSNQNTIARKQEQVNLVADIIKNSPSFVVFEYTSITAPEADVLRKNLFKTNAYMRVYKNNILKRAFSKLDIKGFDEFLIGQTAIIFGSDVDALSPMREIQKVIEEKNEKIKIKTGWFDNNQIDDKKISYLAKLPTRDVLLSQLLSVLQAPIRKFLYALNAVKATK